MAFANNFELGFPHLGPILYPYHTGPRILQKYESAATPSSMSKAGQEGIGKEAAIFANAREPKLPTRGTHFLSSGLLHILERLICSHFKMSCISSTFAFVLLMLFLSKCSAGSHLDLLLVRTSQESERRRWR